jgi:GTP-binding protein HflX
MRTMAKTDVFAENKLFATVDSTVRKVTLGNIPFLLTDTVGFIRKLPTTLIEAFKSTLDEVREADILVHVVDVSHPLFEEQIEVVNATLADIKAADKPMVLVFNKMDQFNPRKEWQEQPDGGGTDYFEEDSHEVLTIPADVQRKTALEYLKKTYLAQKADHVVFISAQTGENIGALRDLLYSLVREKHYYIYPNWVDVPLAETAEYGDGLAE